jgi:hypothetical protein
VVFEPGTCYAPGTPFQVYPATSADCSLPSIIWSGLPGGVTLSMT